MGRPEILSLSVQTSARVAVDKYRGKRELEF